MSQRRAHVTRNALRGLLLMLVAVGCAQEPVPTPDERLRTAGTEATGLLVAAPSVRPGSSRAWLATEPRGAQPRRSGSAASGACRRNGEDDEDRKEGEMPNGQLPPAPDGEVIMRFRPAQIGITDQAWADRMVADFIPHAQEWLANRSSEATEAPTTRGRK